MRYWLTYIFATIPLISFAQNKLITGSVVVDEGNGYYTAVSDVRIENLKSESKTYTSSSGYYSIQANVGDTILFEADFLISRKIVVNQNIFDKGFLQAHLDIETIELGTATIGKGPLQPKYHRDDKTDLYDKIGLDQRLRDLEPKRDIAKFKPLDVLNPVRLIGHMNGFYRDQRRVRNYETKFSLIQEVKHYYPIEFYTRQLEIPEYKIEEFLYYVNARYPLQDKVLSRQFGTIMIDLESYAKDYLKELSQNN
ncbi:hypothetical protein [Empedobacter tilapiae]|uniref:Carboxypeptidase regulatory-like domain-containing protein n=1 Tax=Empedobacter tilapiae TaxID=2491114 RepID=A0A4Z1BN90_9FLAO|nr:hypothetical protein [Empedobacter tilapiae]TGN26309.1 hypothetical protein E4J94_10775 [Empedobacter tilapiae]